MDNPVSTAELFSHETTRTLVVEPLFQQSVALRTLRRITTTASVYYLPKVTRGAATWTGELEPLDEADAAPEMIDITPKRLGNFQVVSVESAEDANAAAIVGQALVAGLADAFDAAAFAGAGPTGPAGLPGFDALDVAGDPGTDLDAYAEAIASLEGEGSMAGAIYLNPADWASLAGLTVTDDSRQPVLSVGATVAAGQEKALHGVPVHLCRHVDAGVGWVVDTSRVCAVVRTDVRLTTSTDAYFERDGVGVKCVMRAEFAAPYEAGTIARIGMTSS